MNVEKLTPYEINAIEDTKKAILEGRIYARVLAASKSGMSRDIIFMYIKEPQDNAPYLVNCTPYIAWLRGKESGVYTYSNGNKEYREDGLRVGGCGMDMIMHTLYSCFPYDIAKDWNQKYSTI